MLFMYLRVFLLGKKLDIDWLGSDIHQYIVRHFEKCFKNSTDDKFSIKYFFTLKDI